MELETFESAISPVIVARGRDYLRAGRVGTVEEIAPGLLHASVDGTVRYDVDVRMRGGRVVSAACSCPYDQSAYCKHVAAVLAKMREGRHEGNPSTQGDGAKSELDEYPHDTYDRILAYLLGKHDTTATTVSHKRAAKRQQEALSLADAARVIEGSMTEFHDLWNDRWANSHGRYSYEDNDVAMAGIHEVADNIERCADPTQACLLAVLALGYTIGFIGTWDDSGGTASDTMDRLVNLLADRCDELAAGHAPLQLKRQVVHALVAAADDPAYAGWGMETSFLARATDLVQDYDSAHLVLAAVIRSEEHNTYEADRLVVTHYRLLERLGDKKAMRAFEKTHALHPFFFLERLEKAFLGHDMDAARTMLEEKTGWGNTHTKKRHVAYTDLSLPRDVFPNGYLTYLEAVYEEQHDSEALLALYRHDIGDGRFGEATLTKLRALAGDEWPRERDRIIDDAIASGRNSDIAERLIRDEGLAEAALRYCKAGSPTAWKANGSERILRLYRLVGEAYPGEAREMLRSLIAARSTRASGRETYREICGIIQRYQSLFGTNEAQVIVIDLRARYSRRRNLMKELDDLEASW